MDANAVAAWEAAYKARTYNLKKGTLAETRANIIEKEAKTHDALLAALPQQDRIEATVTQGLAVATESLRIGCDTNERLCRLEGLVKDMQAVTVRGQTLSGALASVTATQKAMLQSPA